MQKPIHKMSSRELEDLINESDDEGQIEDAYDELERRERALELMDWDEQDRRAAAEERYEMWRNEY